MKDKIKWSAEEEQTIKKEFTRLQAAMEGESFTKIIAETQKVLPADRRRVIPGPSQIPWLGVAKVRTLKHKKLRTASQGKRRYTKRFEVSERPSSPAVMAFSHPDGLDRMSVAVRDLVGAFIEMIFDETAKRMEAAQSRLCPRPALPLGLDSAAPIPLRRQLPREKIQVQRESAPPAPENGDGKMKALRLQLIKAKAEGDLLGARTIVRKMQRLDDVDSAEVRGED